MTRLAIGREIAVALAVKVAALLLLFMMFFSPQHRLDVDAATMQQALLSPGPAEVAQ